jgi:hypothetical protein
MAPGSPRGECQCSWPTTQQLHGEESLLHLRAVLEPKLGLDYTKPVVSLEWLSCLGEERRMSDREVTIGGWS